MEISSPPGPQLHVCLTRNERDMIREPTGKPLISLNYLSFVLAR